jgi:hypothetical protein
MNRQSLPAVLGGTVTRAGFAAGCGGAGSLAALAFVHRLGAPAVAAGAVTAAFAASAVKSLSGAIEAVGNLLTALIRVRADAKATVINAKLRADLARAGLDPGRTSQAAEMQRVLAVNPDLPKDRRPADETLIKLHGATRARGIVSEAVTGPDTPGGARRSPKAAPGKVVPIRVDP